jgi:hypothetical protein
LGLLGGGRLLRLGPDRSNVDLSNRLVGALDWGRPVILVLLGLSTESCNIDLANGLVTTLDHIAWCIVSLHGGTAAGCCGRLLAEIGNIDPCGLVSGFDFFNLSPCDRGSIGTPAILIHVFVPSGPSSDGWVGAAGCGWSEDRLGLHGRRRSARTSVLGAGRRVLGAGSIGHLSHDGVNLEIAF